jgi:hypothetical protein
MGKNYDRRVWDKYDDKWVTADVYRVLDAFKITCPATAHAIQKLLYVGTSRNIEQDLKEAKQSIEEAMAMLMQKQRQSEQVEQSGLDQQKSDAHDLTRDAKNTRPCDVLFPMPLPSRQKHTFSIGDPVLLARDVGGLKKGDSGTVLGLQLHPLNIGVYFDGGMTDDQQSLIWVHCDDIELVQKAAAAGRRGVDNV